MDIDKIQHPKVTARDRAKILAMKWVCGGINTNPTKREIENIEDLATLIYQELELQDRDTRHAIAEKISLTATDRPVRNTPILTEAQAYSIAMNTSAL